MSRTTRSILLSLAAAIALAGVQAHAALPDQGHEDPANIAAGFDYGAFSVVDDDSMFADPQRALSYDNFTLTDTYILDGICFAGIYAEAFPTDAESDTDFLIEIFADDTAGAAWGSPDLLPAPDRVPLVDWYINGGKAGESSAELTVSSLYADKSPVTATNPIGGGDAFGYEADLDPTSLGPGQYWISITAVQEFDTPGKVDPEWMWHISDSTDTVGFWNYDATFPDGTEDIGTQSDKNLAFQLKGAIVPEPSSMLLALGGFLALGMIRRKRS